MNGFTTEFDPEFKKQSIYLQLGKIVDSESARSVVPENKFKPAEYVVTDEGVRFKVEATEAQFMREMLLRIPTVPRADVLKKIQTSDGFKEFRAAIKEIMKGKTK